MMEKIIKIDGMHCMGCVMAVKSELEDLEFIDTVDINVDSKEAIIKCSETEFDINKVKKVIEELGFKVVE